MCVMANHHPCSTLVLKGRWPGGHHMTTIKAFIKSHPLLSYYALVFAISWGCCGERGTCP